MNIFLKEFLTDRELQIYLNGSEQEKIGTLGKVIERAFAEAGYNNPNKERAELASVAGQWANEHMRLMMVAV